MKEASVETIIISVITIIALLSNLWSMTFSQPIDEVDKFYTYMKYIVVPWNFINIFAILYALGTQQHGLFLMFLLLFTTSTGELTRIMIGYQLNEANKRLFITGNMLVFIGFLFAFVLFALHLSACLNDKKGNSSAI